MVMAGTEAQQAEARHGDGKKLHVVTPIAQMEPKQLIRRL
jgi:hypothetical protein